MRRKNNLYQQVYSIDNIELADRIAQKGKSKKRMIIKHNNNRQPNLEALQKVLQERSYKTSAYHTFPIYEPKERIIYSLPYYPDLIVQHAIMNIIEPYFMSFFTADTYSCIKGRGIHAAARNLQKALKDKTNTEYCLKLDIQKFYPSINHDILKALLRRKIKDNALLGLLDEIIDSAPGLPIGSYLSQHLANFYLTYFDHWLKEQKKVKYYFRYADDIVILGSNKPELHKLLAEIRTYLSDKLNLRIKGNYQVFPVDARSIDFIGYRFYHTHILLRKNIKKNFARMLKKRRNRASIDSYMGWAKYCNSRHLIKRIL